MAVDPFVAMLGAMVAFGIIFFLMMLALCLGLYLYFSFALMSIAQKTNTPHAWLAWIPIANFYLMTQIADVPWWTMLLVIAAMFITYIPLVGIFGCVVVLGIFLWWWWKIAEARRKSGWLGLLIIIPVVNLVTLGVLAWSD